MNKKIYSLLSGILIGSCMILPGVSGSVVAIILGMYEEIILLLTNKEKVIGKIKKIFPLLIGISIGIFIFGKILLFLYDKYSYCMMYIFIGLILGSIPTLFNEMKNKNQKFNISCFFLSLIISIILFLLPKVLNLKIENNLNFINLFIGGLLYISGKIIPGISSSFFLMILGLYEYILEAIANPFSINLSKLITLIPFILGVIIGLCVFVKLITYLLNNHFSRTYSAIIGFIMGSVIAIYPGFELSQKGIISLILMIISYEIASKLTKN